MKLKHICEVCGREEFLAPGNAYKIGWGYPPKNGVVRRSVVEGVPQVPY